MILVDTSVWVDHFRKGNAKLAALLETNKVICHPYIIGELACGNLKNRAEILSLLQALPPAVPARDEEVLQFINQHRLMGKGLGYIDVHLLASARLTGATFWSLDKTLRNTAANLL